MDELTPNERRYLECYVVSERRGYRMLLAIYLPFFLSLVSAPLVFGWQLAQRSSKVAYWTPLVSLVLGALGMLPLRSLRERCRRKEIRWQLRRVHGEFAWRTIQTSDLEGHSYIADMPTIGGIEVDLPRGWASRLRKGDMLRGYGCVLPTSSAIGALKMYVLRLDDGFCVDQEVALGLLEPTALGIFGRELCS